MRSTVNVHYLKAKKTPTLNFPIVQLDELFDFELVHFV